MKPTSSMCAAIMTVGAPSFLQRFQATTLPMVSTVISSQ